MRHVRWSCAMLLLVSPAAWPVTRTVRTSMACSRGPSETPFVVTVTSPDAVNPGETFSVRIDSTPSGRLDHAGLNYIYGMTTHYALPPGMQYVPGSARVLADTGTANARPGARIVVDDRRIATIVPARILRGESYTQPSVVFDARLDAQPGTSLAVRFVQYEVMANAFLVGDLHTTCEPLHKGYPVATVRAQTAVNP